MLKWYYEKNVMSHPLLHRLIGFLYGSAMFREMNSVEKNFGTTNKKIHIVVSFDCDREEDSVAIEGLLPLFAEFGIVASFAVTASLIEENPRVYEQVLAAGHEILNHGYTKHTATNISRKEAYSTFFYNDVDWEFIEKEIIAGQETCMKYLKMAPIGFRVPHFGTFQQKDKLEKLYDILKCCGIRYSSSMMVYYMRKYGWQMNSHEVTEFPLSNRVHLPASVLDSYTLIYTPSRFGKKNRFYTEFCSMIRTAEMGNSKMFINFYVDPSHVLNDPQFRLCLEHIHQLRDIIECTTYSELL